ATFAAVFTWFTRNSTYTSGRGRNVKPAEFFRKGSICGSAGDLDLEPPRGRACGLRRDLAGRIFAPSQVPGFRTAGVQAAHRKLGLVGLRDEIRRRARGHLRRPAHDDLAGLVAYGESLLVASVDAIPRRPGLGRPPEDAVVDADVDRNAGAAGDEGPGPAPRA